MRILQLLFGCDEVAAAYSQWLDKALSEQAKTAGRRLRSWDEVAVDSTPIGWGNRDVHGFLCARCGDSCWQVILAAGFPDRLCVRCARELDLEPGQVWAPRLPPAHGHLEYPGLLPGEPHESSITVRLTDDTASCYGLGDATAFLVRSDWGDSMDMTAAGTVSGEAGRPRMEISGSTRRDGHRFAFFVILDFDPAPQGTRQAPLRIPLHRRHPDQPWPGLRHHRRFRPAGHHRPRRRSTHLSARRRVDPAHNAAQLHKGQRTGVFSAMPGQARS